MLSLMFRHQKLLSNPTFGMVWQLLFVHVRTGDFAYSRLTYLAREIHQCVDIFVWHHPWISKRKNPGERHLEPQIK
jgi:hypothetical protein